MKTYTEEDLKRAWEEGYDKADTEGISFTKSIHWLDSSTRGLCSNPNGGFDSDGGWVLINGKVKAE